MSKYIPVTEQNTWDGLTYDLKSNLDSKNESSFKASEIILHESEMANDK